MNISAASALNAGSMDPRGVVAAIAKVSQPTFQATDPFGAYLLSISDSALQAMAIQAQAAAPVVTASQNLGGITGTQNQGILGAALPSALMAVPALVAANGPEALGGLGGQLLTSAIALNLGNGTTTPPVPTPAPVATTQLAPTPVTQANPPTQGGTPTAGPGSLADQAATQAADAVQAAKDAAAAATVDANVRSNQLLVAQAANASANVAVDSTAKYMGAGVLSQVGPGQAGIMAGYPTVLDNIPAVSGLQASPALAAYTQSNAQSQTFNQTVVHPAPMVPPLNPVETSHLDLLT